MSSLCGYQLLSDRKSSTLLHMRQTMKRKRRLCILGTSTTLVCTMVRTTVARRHVVTRCLLNALLNTEKSIQTCLLTLHFCTTWHRVEHVSALKRWQSLGEVHGQKKSWGVRDDRSRDG